MPEPRPASPAMPLLLLLLALLAPPRSAAAQATAPGSSPDSAAADAAFVAETREYLSRLEGLGFAGVVVVARHGVPLLAEGYGLADRERGIRWSPGTVSDIGSITKQFTAAAILALAEDGRLKVTDPITAHFEGVPEDKRAITLHQLLTHSSGIVDLEGYGDWDPLGREEFVGKTFAQPLAFAPGTGYEYSNAGYSLLGAIVERLSGGSWERFLRDRFLLPLGLYETGYVLAGWGEGRQAQGYRGAEKWGTTLERPLAEDGPFWVLRANGGVHTTAYDMLRWTRALLEGRVLSAESRRLLWEPHVREGEDADTFYGYGWAVQDVGEGMRVVTHNGGNGIHFADLALVPSAGIAIFLQTNVAAGNPYVQGLLGRIGFRLAAGRPYPEVPRVVPADPALLSQLAGDWELEGGGRFRATAGDDALVVEPLDPTAFARLLSSAPPDPAALALGAERSRRLDEALRALLAGDHAPLHRLYGGEVTLERLSDVWRERLATFTGRHGAAAGADVLGTAHGEERDTTLVRFRFERGAEEVAFVWRPEPEGRLLGISVAGLPPRLRFRAEAGGGWAAWDTRSGETVPLRVQGSGAAARLLVGKGEQPAVANRPAAGGNH